MSNTDQIDYTSLWVAAIAIEVIIALIAGAIVLSSITAICRARIERVPLTGVGPACWPMARPEDYPEAWVEECENF